MVKRTAVGTCYKCGMDYEIVIETQEEAEEYERLCTDFDPTDWECPDCEAAEDLQYQEPLSEEEYKYTQED